MDLQKKSEDVRKKSLFFFPVTNDFSLTSIFYTFLKYTLDFRDLVISKIFFMMVYKKRNTGDEMGLLVYLYIIRFLISWFSSLKNRQHPRKIT